MENSKDKSSAIVTIICFSLIIIGIVGYFVYDKFIKSNKIEKSFEISISEISLKINEVKDIKDYIELQNIELSDLSFTSSDKDIAYMEDTNIVAPSKEGVATITATYKKIVKKIIVTVGDALVNTGTDVVTKTDEK